MGRIAVDVTGAVEPRPVPTGMYDLVITEAEAKDSKNSGKPQIEVSIGIRGHEDAPNVRHFISLPAPADDPKKASFKQLMLARFLKAFQVKFDSSGFDVEAMVGAEAKCELGIDTPEGGNGATYNRLVLPKLPDEGSPGVQVGGKGTRPPKR